VIRSCAPANRGEGKAQPAAVPRARTVTINILPQPNDVREASRICPQTITSRGGGVRPEISDQCRSPSFLHCLPNSGYAFNEPASRKRALPKTNRSNPALAQHCNGTLVTLTVARDLRAPKWPVRAWRMAAARASVPKTPVNEHRNARSGKVKIRLAGGHPRLR
jgi:hypothetical protein